MAINNQKLKTVENYILDHIKYVNPDQSEIWLTRHRILKKNYMMKRVPYAKDSYLKLGNFDSVDEFNAFRLKKISYEIDILKQLKLSGSPKCQKMIKTSNSVYVVYEQFPGLSLQQLIKAQQLSPQEKLKIMINLSKTLLNYHNFGINFLLLAPENIFRSENQNIFFGEWGSAVYKNNCAQVFPIIITKKSQFIANQVLQEGRCSPASDIYSLGKIFSYLADKSKKNSNGQSDTIELKQLIENMTQKADAKRPSLIEVIEQLQKISKETPKKYDLTHSKGPIKSKLQTKPSEISFNNLESQVQPQKNHQLKTTASITNLKQKFTQQTKEVKKSRLTHAYSFDSILIGMSRAISRPSVSRVKKSCESVAKKMNRARNLSYFIIGLSDFAMKWPEGEVLAYLLLKQAYLILNSCYNEWSNEDFQDKNGKTLTQILKEQILQLNLGLNMLKQYLMPQKCDQQFKIQLRNDLQINQKFYRQQMCSFCHRLMQDFNKSIKENKVKNLTELVDNLFAVYMILKREEQGSYQKFWDKIYLNQYAFLKNQGYFENEKKLGYRYLRSKIAQILNKK